MKRIFATILLLMSWSFLCAQDMSYQRQFEPVVMTGNNIPELIGENVSRIFAFKYEGGSWTQIAVQVDERKWMDISVTDKHPAQEFIYQSNEGNGFDSDDELAFYLEDAGEQAPQNSNPSGVGATRYEVKLAFDGIQKFVYLFTSSTLQWNDIAVGYSYQSTGNYTENSWIDAQYYKGHFAGNWTFDQLVNKYTNQDMIDRVKYRVYYQSAASGESELYWDQGRSTYKGHKVGAVRAIRWVQGAASGPTVTYTMKFYKKKIDYTFNYRVHGIGYGFWMYIDFAKGIQNAIFRNANNTLTLDGNQDSYNSTRTMWASMKSDWGSMITKIDASAFVPLARKVDFFWQDNKNYYDGTGEDTESWGNAGVYMEKIPNLDKVTPTVATAQIYILQPNTELNYGNFENNDNNPPVITVIEQTGGGTPVNISPIANASGNPVSGIAPLQVNFSSAGSYDSDGTIESYSWDFGDGDISTDQNPSHIYGAGNYTATLTVTDDDGATAQDQVAISVSNPPVNIPPVANIISPTNGTQFYIGDQTSILGVGNDSEDGQLSNLAWEITRPDNSVFTASGSSFNFQFTLVGSYTIKLTATDSEGATGTKQITVTAIEEPANQPPVVSINSPLNNAIFNPSDGVAVSGSAIDPEDGVLTALQWVVTKPNGTNATYQNVASFNYVVSDTGSYQIALTATDSDGESRSAQVTIKCQAPVINPPENEAPVANITSPANNAVFESGNSVTVSGNGIDPEDGTSVTLAWLVTKPGGAQITNNSSSFLLSLDVAGSYTIKLTVTDTQGSTGTAQITIAANAPQQENQPPVATIIKPSASGTYYVNQPILYEGSAVDPEDGTLAGSRLSWRVRLPNGDWHNLGTGTTGSATPPSAGTYLIRLTATDSDGLSAIAEQTITVSSSFSRCAWWLRKEGDTEGLENLKFDVSTVANKAILNVAVPSEGGRVTVNVFNIRGQRIASRELNLKNGVHQIDFTRDFIAQGLPSGFYPTSIIYGHQRKVVKLFLTK